MADQSFQTLIYSLLVHAALAWLILHAPSQIDTPLGSTPVEFTVREIDSKSQKIVMETARQEDLLEDLKRKADYLSEFTKRVKDQVRAKVSGETKNRLGDNPLLSDEANLKGQQGQDRDQKRESLHIQTQAEQNGIKVGSHTGTNSFGQNVAVGASTVGEFIPGVKVGQFTALNTDRFTFYTFYARVNEQVRSRWVANLRELSESLPKALQQRMADRERVTEVDIQLDRSGKFVRALVMHSSGFSELDRAGTLAFQNAAPFANPPQQMIENDGLIHLRYGFIVQWSPTPIQVGR